MIRPKFWFDRKFGKQPDFIFPAILERLKDAPLRLENKLKNVPEHQLIAYFEGKWTLKEQAGHLLDLEPLWLGRFQEILGGDKDLREADLSNRKTHEANHNARPIDEILREFRQQRKEIIDLLETVKEADLEKFALHPRLKTPMKITDLAYFVAEHDNHHLAWMNIGLSEKKINFLLYIKKKL